MTTEVDRNDIAFLRSHLDSALDSFKQAAEERDALRAEIEHLRLLGTAETISKGIAETQVENLKAENKRLREYNETLLKVERENAAEIKRLRAVLERIALDSYRDGHAAWASEAVKLYPS